MGTTDQTPDHQTTENCTRALCEKLLVAGFQTAGQSLKYSRKDPERRLRGIGPILMHSEKEWRLLCFTETETKLAKQIMVSLRETEKLTSEEFGTYWAMDKGYYWYQAPIENHVMILEAFHEVEQDKQVVDEMKIWLLKQKQTQDWKTTKATAKACYALLSTGNVQPEC